jgi:hypothetical protein
MLEVEEKSPNLLAINRLNTRLKTSIYCSNLLTISPFKHSHPTLYTMFLYSKDQPLTVIKGNKIFYF